MASDATNVRAIVEQEAEALVVYQLDLLAQLEHQLRAVHLTMRQIEKLRSAKDRIGDELSNGQKIDTLDHLMGEIEIIEQELATQHDSCRVMLETVEHMRQRLRQIRVASSGPVITRQHDDPPPASTRQRRKRR